MKIRKWNIVSLVLLIIWMGVIFSFSAKPADASSEMSMTTGRFIGHLVITDYKKLSHERQEAFAEKIEHGVRKTAHALEYALLGILIVQVFISFCKIKGIYMVICFCMGASYAVTDEIHQLFVPGRSEQIGDVIIDSTGVLLGVLFSYGIYKYIGKKKLACSEKHHHTLV